MTTNSKEKRKRKERVLKGVRSSLSRDFVHANIYMDQKKVKNKGCFRSTKMTRKYVYDEEYDEEYYDDDDISNLKKQLAKGRFTPKRFMKCIDLGMKICTRYQSRKEFDDFRRITKDKMIEFKDNKKLEKFKDILEKNIKELS